MSKNQTVLPATEIVERANQIARVGATNDDGRVWGAMNDVYLRELPHAEDWTFLLASSSLITTAKYGVGTASVNTGDTAVTFSGGAAIPAALTGCKIRFTDNANVYDFTRTGAATGTISPPLSEDRNVSGGAYVVFQPTYALAGNFNRFPKNGGLTLWAGNRPTPIPEQTIQGSYEEYSATPSRPARCRLVTAGTDGTQKVALDPAPDKAYVLPYDYFMTPSPLTESTAGVVTINAGSITVVGSAGTTRFTEASVGWWFRVDSQGEGSQSEWYRILAITHDSSLTLQTAYGKVAATTATYTLCPAPAMPEVMQEALLHGTVKRLLSDQNDTQYAIADSLQSVAIMAAKRLYKSRIYNQPIGLDLEDYNFRR